MDLLKGPKGLTDEFYGFIKSRKRSIFVIDSHSNQCIYSSQKECKVLNKVYKRGTICQYKVFERGSFMVKNGV